MRDLIPITSLRALKNLSSVWGRKLTKESLQPLRGLDEGMARVVDDFDVGDVVESLLLGGFGHPKFDRGIGDDHVRVHLFDPRLVGRHHAVMAVGEVECAAVVDDDERLRQPAL